MDTCFTVVEDHDINGTSYIGLFLLASLSFFKCIFILCSTPKYNFFDDVFWQTNRRVHSPNCKHQSTDQDGKCADSVS